MGKKSKLDPSAQPHMNDYEKSRMLRIQENQARLRDMGIKNIAQSLISLGESKKEQKRKEKQLVSNASKARDADYVPDFGDDDSDGNQEEQVTNTIKVHKKQHRPQYIAPMPINKYANLAKKRVMGPDESHERNGEFFNSNATKKTTLNKSEKGHVRDRQFVDTNAKKRNQSGGKISMAEVIKNKRGSQRQDFVFKDTLTNPRRKLFFVDHDDDDEEDGDTRSQEHDGVEADEDEYIEDMMSENIRNEMARDDASSEDVNELGPEQDDIEANEYMEQAMFENNQPEIERNEDDEDDLQSEDDGRVSQSEKSAVSGISMKKRGPTMMHGVQLRKFHEREVIICNDYGQPIGPVTEEKDIVGGFSRFLGTVARNNSFAPLTYESWHKVPHKDKIWEYVLQKYEVPENAKSWVLMSIGADWRGYKCRLKKKHFFNYPNNRTRWDNRPQCIPQKDFSKLLRLWNNKEVMKRSMRARKIRMSQKNMHTAGPKSFARIREEMRNEDPNKEPPSLAKMFERTRRRTEGNTYVDTPDNNANTTNQIENYKPKDGHHTLYGRGVTNKLVKKVNGNDKADSEVEKNNLLVMRKELEEDHERKKAELERKKAELDEDHERKKAELADDHGRKKAELEAMKIDFENN